MNVPVDLLPSGLLLTANCLVVLLLVVALWLAPWRQFRAGNAQHVFLGAVVALLLLWRFDVGVTPGLGFHFLGVTVFTLMFGWSLAVIGVGLAALGLVVSSAADLEPMALNVLLLGILPVSVSYGIYHLVERALPHHVFVYIFLCAFFGAIVAAAVSVFALVGVLTATDTYGFDRIAEEYLPFLPLYLFPEGLLNGMLTTLFVGIRPQWLATFDDESYLQR